MKQHRILFCITISLWILFPFIAGAQKLKFDQLNVQQGLPASEVYNLYEDAKGYIWAFTEYGIVKHNGTAFIPVCRNISIDQSAVYVVRQSLKGDMYIANSGAQIFRIVNDSAFMVKVSAESQKEILDDGQFLYDLVVDDSLNKIYCSTLNTSYLLSGNKIKSISPDYEKDSGIICFKELGNQYIALKTRLRHGQKGFVKVVDNKDSVVCKLPHAAVMNERSAIRKVNNIYYILQTHKITRIKDAIKKELEFRETMITLEPSPNGHLWVGTSNGLYELDPELHVLRSYFEDCVVSDILFDRFSGMWVSTIEKGIYYCKNIHNTYYDNVEDLSKHISLLKHVGDKFFIGTSRGYLFVKDHGRIKKVNLENNTSCITDITHFNNQYIIGTKARIMTLDDSLLLIKNNKHFTVIDDYGDKMSCYGFSNEDTDTLLFIAGSAIVKNIKNIGCSLSAYKLYINTRCIIQRGKECLVGTTKGLLMFDGRFYCPGYLNVFRNKSILKLRADHNKNIWICTKLDGLYLLSPDNILKKMGNIPSENINNITFIQDTILLLSTNKGLFINKLNGINNGLSWQLLQDDEVLAAEYDQDEIYIATKHGLVGFDAMKLFHQRPPLFYLESMRVNDNTKEIRNARLSYKENDLYFNFDVLAYHNPEQAISYQLEGPSPGSGIISGRQLHLQNLSPGRYVLNAYLVVASSVEQPEVISISFFIRPAFWQTGWFYALIIFLSLSLFALILWLIYWNFRKKELRKTMLIRQIAEYRLTALKAQINPHFISNSLSAVQQLIFNNEIDRANQYIAKFSLLIRYVLKYSDKSATYLDNELKIIDINVELEQLRFDNQFIFEKDIHQDIQMDEILVPTLITQPIIENAIWHGLLPLKGKRAPRLILKIDLMEENLVISVIDNGVGRKKTEDHSSNHKRESKGTWLVNNWIENLNQLSVYKGAAIHFIDLQDQHGHAAGTQVDIILPLQILNGLYHEKDRMHHH